MSQLDTIPPQLLRFGDATLYETSLPFKLPDEMPLVHQTLQLMEQATKNLGIVGIAAPQIGILKRLVMFEVPAEHPRYKTDGVAIPMRALINPTYKPLSNEQNLEWEACLSISGMMGKVPRYTHIEYTYTDLEGKIHTHEASHFHARVVQHELDHLDGILYPLRIKDMRTFGFREEILTSPAFLESKP
jgi:peptide deformylase